LAAASNFGSQNVDTPTVNPIAAQIPDIKT